MPRLSVLAVLGLAALAVAVAPFVSATEVTTPGAVLVSLRTADGRGYLIAQIDGATGNVVPLTNPPPGKSDMNPSVSPDLRSAVFYSDRSGNQQIWHLDIASRVVKQLTAGTLAGSSCYDPKYALSGQKILFKSNYNDGFGDVWVMNADGSSPVNLTPNLKTTEEWGPVFSADGRQIFFTSRMVKADPNSDEIFVMDADGKNQRRLTSNTVPDWYPAPNPCTGAVTFVSKTAPGKPDALFTMRADGGGRAVLLQTANDLGDPTWTVDGARLAYVKSGGVSNAYQTWTLPAGGQPILLSSRTNAQTLGPAWFFKPANYIGSGPACASAASGPATTTKSLLSLKSRKHQRGDRQVLQPL